MKRSNAIALKEWAAVCAALEAGKQSILLRTGGIAEGGDGFRVQHQEFWLYPTRFHQDPAELIEGAAPLIEAAEAEAPPPGRVRLSLFATVDQVRRIWTLDEALDLTDRHILSEATVRQRFDYREPGLYAINVHVDRLEVPHEIPELPEYAGCHSWVDLGTELPTPHDDSALQDA